MTAAIVDNTVLSNFAHIKQPNLLKQSFTHLVTVSAVMDELNDGVQLGRIPNVDWQWLQVIKLTQPEQSIARQLQKTLGKGEAECIALAQSRQWIVLTDDRDARKTAKQAGVKVSGTLGALISLVDNDVLSMKEADEVLAAMMAHGYRCPVKSLTELLP